MKKCVINYASENWYPRGQQRLQQSLKDTGFNGDFLKWSDAHEIGSPTHQEAPYAFKPHALKSAFTRGYELVLWCDASVWAVKPIDSVFGYLSEHSHMFFYNTCAGEWTSDACLNGFGISREAAMKIPMLMGICMGFNLTHDVTRKFLNQWLEKSRDGFSFPGDWRNDHNQVSSDPRCKGHRHDQSVASILAFNLGMEYIVPHETFFSYWSPSMKESVVLTGQGM